MKNTIINNSWGAPYAADSTLKCKPIWRSGLPCDLHQHLSGLKPDGFRGRYQGHRKNKRPFSRQSTCELYLTELNFAAISENPCANRRRDDARHSGELNPAICCCSHATDTDSTVDYSLKRQEALTYYLDDGVIPIDNTGCQQAHCTVVTGRRLSWCWSRPHSSTDMIRIPVWRMRWCAC